MMGDKFAEELYADSLHLSKPEHCPASAGNSSDAGDVWEEDECLWDDSEDRLDSSTDLEREWQRRRDRFFTIGYRDGLIAGKEASAQEGFNLGYKFSVPVGYNWGIVRGVTSALALLPDGLKERLVEDPEERVRYQNLHQSVRSLSASEAFKLFSNEILLDEKTTQSEDSKVTAIHRVSSVQQQSLQPVRTGDYVGELKELLSASPAIVVHLDIPSSSTP
ncbi:hypothetical protein SAY87_002947 [Trapa incisa]|uniref:Essential protein Yae1 N-terminal domain-containing protein n=1 Tax=Trapa incisa TaxID=236973 RepID=A0AAN7QH20_9MYRT|nr:hypothetical protein SAY87_002947 [Trapa incisa]